MVNDPIFRLALIKRTPLDLIFKRQAFKVIVQISSKENRNKAFALFEMESACSALLNDIDILIQGYKYLHAFHAIVSLNILSTYPNALTKVAIPLIARELEGALYYYINIKKEFQLNDWRDIVAYNIDKYPLMRLRDECKSYCAGSSKDSSFVEKVLLINYTEYDSELKGLVVWLNLYLGTT
ncbi:unnamed protein product [Lepeophtheirus salmonis]|uniref:(salmon louse) hypothetical protein n=1 Tax=Lepeophtheirus salmonis TaxID=72036 RepID=A0A7R8CRQ9_LEPSM|nr:unnamed protein product [Lepeophtheirus salmonis]CAF2858713.1 unnamed protein product [Lepeophtheirus salmonis]